MLKSIFQHAIRRGTAHCVGGGLHSTTSTISALGVGSSSPYSVPTSPGSFSAAGHKSQHAVAMVGFRPFSAASSPPRNDDVIYVSIDEARNTTAAALRRIGWDETDAALQAEIMTAAELCGNNQGLVKMYDPTQMAPKPNAGKPMVERDTPSSAVINANQAPGMLAAITAADLAVQKLHDGQIKLFSFWKNDSSAATNNSIVNISIVSSYNTSTSSGQLAFYVERIARQGYIGIALCNSPELVAAAPGGKPVFGTNPLAVGIPTGPAGTTPFTVCMYACPSFVLLQNISTCRSAVSTFGKGSHE
jgi:Malate/L-lactate dehydrogenase